MNYIDEIAEKIRDEITRIQGKPTSTTIELLRIYALLALTTGTYTTLSDVHDGWAVWRAATNPGHKDLIPFTELTENAQQHDKPYRDAIRNVAETL